MVEREVCVQFSLTVKVVCAQIKKHQKAGAVDDKSRISWSKKTTTKLDGILVETSLVDGHLTSADTGSCAALQSLCRKILTSPVSLPRSSSFG